MDRASGRNRSEIPDLDARLSGLVTDLKLLGSQPQGMASDRALFFTAEAFAAALFQRFRAHLFESRLGMPKNDAEVFSILQGNGILDQAQARKLRQFCELRFLSSRDLAKIDRSGIFELVSDLNWITALLDEKFCN